MDGHQRDGKGRRRSVKPSGRRRTPRTGIGPVCGPGNDPSIVYSMTETKGCTCEQIVGKMGAGEGHLKKGCSPSLMEEFTGISHEPDRQAGIGKNPKKFTGKIIDFFKKLFASASLIVY